ncbi:MAG: cryptochrome/photolyase family protein [Puniceicoccaceae bacterium MED-G30]|jgi:deoxyribodipyrimidine photolyase-related protein|nr:MAG: cryptochrome/photolyase family protein [Puniceicoccaceae bacterium MED-G30]
MNPTRNLVIVLGDQLDREAAAFDGFDPAQDQVWMAEVSEESTHVWTHKQRIVLFLSAMRHFRDDLCAAGIPVDYTELSDSVASLGGLLEESIAQYQPECIVLTRPGEWRVLEMLREVCRKNEVPLDLREDRHFYTTPADFAAHAEGRKGLRMEFFYRELRRRFAVLMEGDQPVGGVWNFDKDNRGSFGKEGPGKTPSGPDFAPDSLTREVLDLVASRFSDHPGQLESFRWPVTRSDALRALDLFVEKRLCDFGKYQDAMWTGEPWLYHSLISTSLNLKLLNPRDAVEAAEKAYRAGLAPIEAVEGFIRQILGWREYVRGIYWLKMPEYLELNAMQAKEPLPDFFWTGETDLECLRQSIGQTLEYGYAHHIQRLMVTGLYTLLLGVDPKEVHAWYLAVYVDAVEWVELPNSLGMSQYADGGLMASKPYIATGKYIHKMSNYCKVCPKNPAKRTGPDACPFSTLYWDYLSRHESALRKNQRMSLQVRNLDRIEDAEREAIQLSANEIREQNRNASMTST